MAYLVGDAVFVGDTLFMPDVGTARCRLPRRRRAHAVPLDAQAARPAAARRGCSCATTTRPQGREPQWETTVAEQRAHNIHVHDGISEDEFVAMRTARDATLEVPTLILPSIQVNIRAGQLPPPEENGVSYLKIPLNAL